MPLRLLLFFLSAPLLAQPAPRHHASAASPEARATAAFLAARTAGPLPLHAFLERMPKGADLHMHLSGAVYAETFLRDAAEDQLCVDPVKLALVRNLGPSKTLPPDPVCPPNTVAAASVFKNQPLYDALVDSFSMRAFVPTPGLSGHDQFFATFPRFGGLGKSHTGEFLDEVATRAAAQNEQYLEIMNTPPFTHAATLGYTLGWPGTPHPATTAASSTPDDDAGASPAELAALRDKLLAAGLRDEVPTDRAEFAEALADRRRREHCDSPAPLPACAVDIHFLVQVLRAFPPQQVFAQTLLAFEVADAEARDAEASGTTPNVVGLNFVQPEDAYLAMSEYHRQMLMLRYLHSVYPRVHLSLHAGELAPALVPPAGLRFHIREAVELAHAERIGHGVDALYETDPGGLLRELATRHVMVEINLTSNDVILGLTLAQHPLPAYLAAGVPVALSTDDEGVSRIDLTHEYLRAATDFHLPYPTLKRMARTGLEHTFLPGPSLWATPDTFTRPAPPCAAAPLGTPSPTPTCAAFLKSSPHAAAQWQLEHRFTLFESTF